MDTNNWRPDPPPGDPTMDAGDWRLQLPTDSRQRNVNEILDTLKRNLPFSGPEGLSELRKIAVRFEEKIFTAANNQFDYRRRISSKLFTMETKSQNTMPNGGNNSKAPDLGSQGMQNQVQSQEQSIPIPLQSNQSQTRQQLLPQNVHNNMLRLQKIRPPPLTPIKWPRIQPPVPAPVPGPVPAHVPAPVPPPAHYNNAFVRPGMYGQPSPTMLQPMIPGDAAWSNTPESPVSAYMRYLQTSLIDPSPAGNQVQPQLYPSVRGQPQIAPPSSGLLPNPLVPALPSPRGVNGPVPGMPNLPSPRMNDPIPPMPNLPSPRMNGPALLPSPTSQFLLPLPTDFLPAQGQTSQPLPQQQQLMPQMQSQSTQLQQQLGLQQQPNQLQRDMQKRLKASAQTSRNLFQSQNMIDQQKQLYRSQIAPETSSRCWAMKKDDFLASLKNVLDSLYPNNMTNESFQDVNEHLIPDILHMYGEKDEIERMNEKSVRLSRHLTVGMKLLIDEIKYLKDKNEELATKNDKLTSEIIKIQLRSPNKGLEQILQTEESHNSPSKSHGDYPSVQQFCDVEMDDACYGNHLSVDQQLGDLEMNDIFSDTRVSIDDNSKSFRSGISPTQSAMYEFLKKLEADVTGDVKLSDFSNLEGELIKIGRYNFPSSLITMVERIKTFHGDVSVNVKINRSIAEAVYVMFCAVIKEMDDLQLGEITEDKMLKWRDVINDALHLNFNVGFAMEHLKKVARAYFGLKPTLLLKSKISKLEEDLKFYKENHEFLDSIHATQKFLGENAEGIAPFSTLLVSTGLFIMPSAC